MEAAKPIAVIGMACRLPGGISSPEDLWEACCQRRSGWSEIPKSRFNHDSFYHPNHDRPGSYIPEGAHFLQDDISLFDAPFFRITAKEAKAMDPQHRIWLECAYEALENCLHYLVVPWLSQKLISGSSWDSSTFNHGQQRWSLRGKFFFRLWSPSLKGPRDSSHVSGDGLC